MIQIHRFIVIMLQIHSLHVTGEVWASRQKSGSRVQFIHSFIADIYIAPL